MKKAIVKCGQSNNELHIIEIENETISISIDQLDSNIQETEDEDLFIQNLWSKTIEVCKENNCDEVYCFESEMTIWSK